MVAFVAHEEYLLDSGHCILGETDDIVENRYIVVVDERDHEMVELPVCNIVPSGSYKRDKQLLSTAIEFSQPSIEWGVL